jgi:L,D-transpeptidase catalytic domain/Putative peptidoglycan binding domain
MGMIQKIATIALSSLLVLTFLQSSALAKGKKRIARPPSRAEVKEAERRLAEMGFWTGPIDGVLDDRSRLALTTFQKWVGRSLNGRLTRDEFNAVMDATPPQPRDAGYKHVEIDLDRQVLLLSDDGGATIRILPVSTGSGRRYNEKGIRGLAYTPRGRFRIYGKINGWRKSNLGLLFYPNYFSNGLAIHGNPSVPNTPRSHGCIRIPMFASREISRQLAVGTIVIIYDQDSFVSAKDWAEADKQKQASSNQ